MGQDQLTSQQSICAKVGSEYFPSEQHLKIGISAELLNHSWKYPLNGLRVSPESETTGWFIWSGTGELSQEDDYFKPLHTEHLVDVCPEILPYLGLAPGWRFLIAPDHEDVWFDENLFSEK